MDRAKRPGSDLAFKVAKASLGGEPAPARNALRAAFDFLRRWLLLTAVVVGPLAVAGRVEARVWEVGNTAELATALSGAQAFDEIRFTANITLTADLPVVQADININGAGYTLSGDNKFRGLFVYSGKVGIFFLTITNAIARGGNGGAGLNNGGGGGGGAGLGGALFVASGASVSVADVILQNNSAQGGNGGASAATGAGGSLGGGGGGMGGNGGASVPNRGGAKAS